MTDHPRKAASTINYFADNPISTASEDLLQRSKFVERIVREIDMIDASQGYVLAVMGQWGSGKTSVLNLVKEQLSNSGTILVEYNPWLLSGVEELVDGLFREINAKLNKKGVKYRAAIDKIIDYGEMLTPLTSVPVVGAWANGVLMPFQVMAKHRNLRTTSVVEQKEQVAEALTNMDSSIVVIVDDIDRLDKVEVREIFKLVRLTANFPNVIYLLSFDRIRVENALTEDGVPGRAYLEKIVQNGFEIPLIPRKVLTREVAQALDSALEQVKVRLDREVWDNTLLNIVVPAIKNMRDVRRLAMAVRSTAAALTDSIEVSDIVALETMRLFLPDAFWYLVAYQLPEGNSKINANEIRGKDEKEINISQALSNVPQDEAIIDAFLRITLPTSSYYDPGIFSAGIGSLDEYLRKRRVAYSEVRKIYLEQVLSDRLIAFANAEIIYQLTDDSAALAHELNAIADDELEDVISDLGRFAGKYSEVGVVNVILAILGAMTRLPRHDDRSVFMPEVRFNVTYTVGKILEQYQRNGGAVEAAVDAIISRLRSLSARLEFILLVGHVPDKGRRIVSPSYAQRLQQQYEQDVAVTQIEQLMHEDNLLNVLIAPVYWGSSIAQRIDVTAPLSVHYAVFRSSAGENRCQSSESTHIHRTPVLAWGKLCGVYSDESTIEQVYNKMCEAPESDSADLLELIKKYLDGWRPEEID
jgi:KAP family P-loop domain protein